MPCGVDGRSRCLPRLHRVGGRRIRLVSSGPPFACALLPARTAAIPRRHAFLYTVRSSPPIPAIPFDCSAGASFMNLRGCCRVFSLFHPERFFPLRTRTLCRHIELSPLVAANTSFKLFPTATGWKLSGVVSLRAPVFFPFSPCVLFPNTSGMVGASRS